jgi:hypothetical protein
MATIEIFAWKEHFVEGNAVYDHANSEFRKHLRRGVKASPAEIRRLARQVVLRQRLCLRNVHDEAVYGLIPVLARNCTILRRGSVYLFDEPRV